MRYLKSLLLFIIPLFIIFNILTNIQDEFWKGKYDPDYCYLLNGLNLANTHGNIGMFEHPGTTVQVISAVIIKITYFFHHTSNNIQEDVLHFPEHYLKIIAWTFTIVNCLLLLFAGLIMYKITNVIAYGLLFQSISLFSPVIMTDAFYRVKPEPVLFGVILVFMLLFLTKYYFNNSLTIAFFNTGNNEKRTFFLKNNFSALVFGSILGFCFATKINSIPLIILPLFFIPNKQKVLFLFIVILSFVFFTLPIYYHYINLYNWLVNIFTHTGQYGAGTNEVIDPHQFYNNFKLVIMSEPLIVLTLSISFVFILKLAIQKEHNIQLKLLIGLFLVQLIDLIIVLKHFSVRYFVPIYPTISVSLFILFEISSLSEKAKAYIICSLIVVLFLLNTHVEHKTLNKISKMQSTDTINIYGQGCESPIYALKFGEYYSNFTNYSSLERLYGEQYFYKFWSYEFIGWNSWKKPITLDSLFEKKKTLILHIEKSLLEEYKPPFKTKLLSTGNYLIVDDNKKP